DHQWLRKRTPFEPSARVPMLMYGHGLHDETLIPRGEVVDAPVELMDIMPTLLEIAGADVPETVEGASLLPLVRGKRGGWRDYVHGECAMVPTADSGMQYLTDGRRKYVWWPGQGVEQFFDLEQDPDEMHDLAQEASRADEIARWRQRLIAELTGRPEGFVANGKLAKLDGPTPSLLPIFDEPAKAGAV
ncbi:MAG: sulfatase/phosphatase domain-containing protein, partial [Phycisphaeraceae bacterium]